MTLSKLQSRLTELSDGASDGPGALAGRLDDLAASHPDKPDWRRSLVDLLGLLDLDTSYGARKRLALELGYSEDLVVTKGAAEMNRWLMGELGSRLAASGLELPLEMPS